MGMACTRGVHVQKRKTKLYEGAIEPADLCQGQVGDCWLVAAMASAAEHPAAIRNVFITKERNARGLYKVRRDPADACTCTCVHAQRMFAHVVHARGRCCKVRLYHPEKKRWVIVTVDDRVPCRKGSRSPLFMKQVARERARTCSPPHPPSHLLPPSLTCARLVLAAPRS